MQFILLLLKYNNLAGDICLSVSSIDIALNEYKTFAPSDGNIHYTCTHIMRMWMTTTPTPTTTTMWTKKVYKKSNNKFVKSKIFIVIIGIFCFGDTILTP